MMPPAKQIFNRIVNRVKDLAFDQVASRTIKNNPNRILTYDVVQPQVVSKANSFPDYITPPMYALGELEDEPDEPVLKETMEINMLRGSCKLAKKMLNAAKNHIKVGLTTDELDKYIHDLIIKNQAYPSPLRYHDFPKSICTSVNNIVVHGIPDNRPLLNGDIITVDVTVYYQGYHGDCAATFLVGDVDEEGQYLVETAESILLKTISHCKPGERLMEIGKRISFLADKANLTVIPCVFGHGIGQFFHEPPEINHYIPMESIIDESYEPHEYMVPGMTFTIEPVFGTGTQETELHEDGWTLATVDDSRTAQFEHTILITDTGAEILTK